MKANEAPEKIYISNFDIEALPKNEQLSERWHEVSTEDTDIEYIRTDAFIEKACEWLKKNVTYTHPRKGTEECVVNLNAFIEAMKGE